MRRAFEQSALVFQSKMGVAKADFKLRLNNPPAAPLAGATVGATATRMVVSSDCTHWLQDSFCCTICSAFSFICCQYALGLKTRSCSVCQDPIIKGHFPLDKIVYRFRSVLVIFSSPVEFSVVKEAKTV